MVDCFLICTFLGELNAVVPCQSLERRLIQSTAKSCGQKEFRVGGDYTKGNDDI